MAIRVVRLGEKRNPDEGTRLGTVLLAELLEEAGAEMVRG